MCSGRGDGQLRPPGFPIRKSPDQCLVADSPGLIAGSNVLHRLLVPRHPPCALINLATTRCSRPLCSSQDTGGPATKPAASAAGRHGPRETSRARSLRTQQRARPAPHPPPPFQLPRREAVLDWHRDPAWPNNQTSTDEQPPRDTRPGHGSGREPAKDPRQVLLRKEVIQPHL